MVTFDISISLDGYVAGPGDDVDRLHAWVYGLASWRERHGIEGGTEDADAEVLEEAFASVGALVMGRRMFDLAEGPWGDDPPFHAPVFVATHRGRDPLPKAGGTTFEFVTEGVETAVARAREAAGEADVSVAGGADVIGQALAAGLVDQFQLHVVPVLLGAGVRLFDGLGSPLPEVELTRVVDSPGVTHQRYRVVR